MIKGMELLPPHAHPKNQPASGPGETWLPFPVDEKGYNRESNTFVTLVRFPVALKPLKGAGSLAKKASPRKATAKK